MREVRAPFFIFAKMPRIVVTAVHISFKVIERNQDRVNKLVLAMSLGKPTEQHSCATYCLLLRPTLTFFQKAHRYFNYINILFTIIYILYYPKTLAFR